METLSVRVQPGVHKAMSRLSEGNLIQGNGLTGDRKAENQICNTEATSGLPKVGSNQRDNTQKR